MFSFWVVVSYPVYVIETSKKVSRPIAVHQHIHICDICLDYTWQFFVAFLGWLSDPVKWFSDLQLGDKQVTLNHLVYIYI